VPGLWRADRDAPEADSAAAVGSRRSAISAVRGAVGLCRLVLGFHVRKRGLCNGAHLFRGSVQLSNDLRTPHTRILTFLLPPSAARPYGASGQRIAHRLKCLHSAANQLTPSTVIVLTAALGAGANRNTSVGLTGSESLSNDASVALVSER